MFCPVESGNDAGTLVIHCQVLTSQVTRSLPDRDRPVIGQHAALGVLARERQGRKVIIKTLSVSAGYFGGVTAPPAPAPCSGLRPEQARQVTALGEGWLAVVSAAGAWRWSVLAGLMVTTDAIARPAVPRSEATTADAIRRPGAAVIYRYVPVFAGNPISLAGHSRQTGGTSARCGLDPIRGHFS